MLAGALMLGSCSIFKGSTTSDNSSGTINTTAVKPGKKDKKNRKHKNKGNDDERSRASELNVKPTAEQLCGGQWTIMSVGKVSIEAEDDTPYVNFDDKGRFYASDGCNIINGDYALRSDGTLAFSHVLSTMKYCPDVEYSALIASMLNDNTATAVDCRQIGADTYLYFKNNTGNIMMTLRRHNMEFLNGNWLVTSIDGKKINDDEVTIFIDIPELKIHGNTGCNFFNGDIYIDPQTSNAIDFSNMGLTRMACPKADRESAMLVALETTRTAIAGKNDDTVLFINSKGKEVMTLKRIPLSEQNNE